MDLLYVFHLIYQFILSHTPLVSFFGTLLFGGETAALLSFGAAQGDYSILWVLVFGFIGIMVSDILWYAVGKYSLLSFFKRHHLIHTSSKKATNLFHKLYQRKFRLMFFSRFIYGTSIITLIYLGKRMKFSEFLFYESLISIFWVLLYASIGWFAGKGFRVLFIFYDNLWFVGLSLALLVGFVLLIGFIINYVLLKMAKKK